MGDALTRIVNFTRREENNTDPVQIGKLRYAAAIRNPEAPEAVPVRMTAEDLLAQRTALFGMTRTGKSNTTKTIASAVFRPTNSEKSSTSRTIDFRPQRRVRK